MLQTESLTLLAPPPDFNLIGLPLAVEPKTDEKTAHLLEMLKQSVIDPASRIDTQKHFESAGGFYYIAGDFQSFYDWYWHIVS
jgi:hypothetical protein